LAEQAEAEKGKRREVVGRGIGDDSGDARGQFILPRDVDEKWLELES
jgi:hypothetical protein